MSSTALSLNLQTKEQVAWAAAIALVGSTYFALAVLALQFLRPDLNPIAQPASRYAIGPYSFLMTLAFFSMSTASFALVAALYRGVAEPARSRLGLTLFSLWGIGVLIAMIFPMDVEGAPQTLAGIIHSVSGPLAFLSVCAGVFLISRRFQQDAKWRPLYRTALVLSLLLWISYIGTFLSFVTQSGFLGLFQRTMLAVLVIWILLTASRLLITWGQVGRRTEFTRIQ